MAKAPAIPQAQGYTLIPRESRISAVVSPPQQPGEVAGSTEASESLPRVCSAPEREEPGTESYSTWGHLSLGTGKEHSMPARVCRTPKSKGSTTVPTLPFGHRQE